MSSSKDHPALLLNKNSYQYIAVQVKPNYSNICSPCCYSAENSLKVYKWKPNDAKWQLTNGELGKKIMKIREKSKFYARCCCP